MTAWASGGGTRENRGVIVRTHPGWLLSMAAPLVLAGCTVGEHYRRPDIAAPVAFRGAPAETAADSVSLAEQKWFEVFDDENLQGLIRTALARNRSARDAVARVEAARAALGITRADQFPTVDAFANVAAVRSS